MTRNAIHVRSGFTLMELMVAVSLLVLVILGVGMIFQNTSKAVGLSQATTDTFAGVRALSRQIEKDVSSLDTNGFLVIRSRNDTVDTTRRFDQISFLAKGSFRNMTGTTNTNPFTDRTVGNAAHVWYGQLVMAADGATVTTPDATVYTNESVVVPLSAMPTGVRNQDFVLGRHVTLLLPDDGATTPGGYSAVSSASNLYVTAVRRNFTNAANAVISRATGIVAGEVPDAAVGSSITSSRIGAAGYTPEFLMNWIRINAGARASSNRFEATYLCYRFRALPSIWDTASSFTPTGGRIAGVTNGYFRMTPIMLSGVPSFQVDWTDGSTNNDGSLKWYGLSVTGGDAAPHGGYTGSVAHTEPDLDQANTGDDYTAQFTFDNKNNWPKALRFTYRVTDPNDRLAGGRTFTQIVALPK